ncbi:2-iminoacetate synthase ThiH [Spirochaetia bacterium 38H-sp]|uniref:2-iminoacetate synthase ThiH n=1 Tax=Rarispira pelagica TaxID=3141764 RepID=A0ABU9UC17_9SPIR
MSGFADFIEEWKDFDFSSFLADVKEKEVKAVLTKHKLDYFDFLKLLSPAASGIIEEIAKHASRLTARHFGRVISLYTPLYISNYCVNKCVYCSFNHSTAIRRHRLELEEIEKEAIAIKKQGFRDVLILTGEDRHNSSPEYIKDAVELLVKYFASVGIEVYPLTQEEYKMLVSCGLDYLTLYQEVYHPEDYPVFHPSGPKNDYQYRLQAPERAAKAGLRSVSIGSLLGLGMWQREVFFTAMHAKFLSSSYPDVEWGLSVPRIRPNSGGFEPVNPVSEKDLVKIILAYRIFLPHVGISLSTRERPFLRDNLIGLGVTRMSAASITQVGGHAENNKGTGQFEVSDTRGVKEVCHAIRARGHQPVFQNWVEGIYRTNDTVSLLG